MSAHESTNKITAVNLDEVPVMEQVTGPAETTATRLTLRSGHQLDLYETSIEIMHLAHLGGSRGARPGS
jgi:hypothetical protein